MYGPLPPKTLPPQDSVKARLLADRWWRSNMAQGPWSKRAKECVDFFEGRQWTEAQLRYLDSKGRPALTFNKIAPLVRLVLGYMRNNKTDITFIPATEGMSDEQVAEVLSKIVKQIGVENQMAWVDAEVFMDGILTGRGFYDARLDFENNDLGEVKVRPKDPFTIFVDPDADQYDLNESAKHLTESRWGSLDEVETCYGPEAANLVRPFIGTANATWGGFPILDMSGPEITPRRTFGEVEDRSLQPFQDFFHTELIDAQRKVVRILDQQHKVTTWGPCFIDLETGDRVPVPAGAELATLMPDTPPAQRQKQFIEKTMFHAQQLNNPLVVQNRPYKRVRWTVMIGDALVHDDWSPYQDYTITGYFPYFRRGVTRGMVEDMLDPQREVNKRRSGEIEILGRTAHSGFLFHENGLDDANKTLLRTRGSDPGLNLQWKGDAHMKPEKINPSPPPTAMERLEDKARADLREISGINESALGELDRVQSGRAIEARQRQAVIAIQMYMDNMSRTKELLGRSQLGIIQRHYTESRIFRILGEDGKTVTVEINKTAQDPNAPTIETRINDVTVGKYNVAVDETPLSASFANAQFEEMMMFLEKMGPLGPVLMQLRPDLVVDLSSLPRKEEWIEALKAAATAAAGQQPPPGGAPPGGGPMPAPAAPPAPGAPSLTQSATPTGPTPVRPAA